MESPATATELIRTHQVGVWRYLRFLGCDADRAEDFVQDAFLAVLRKGDWAGLPRPAQSQYLRTTARNLYLMSLREADRHPTMHNLDMIEDVWGAYAADDDGETYIATLRTCLETLDGRAREAIEMRYRQNRSREAIGAALSLSTDGVKTLLRRARDLLRQCVERKLNT